MAPDLGLDLRLSTSKFVTHFSKQASSSISDSNDDDDDDCTKIAKLEAYVRSLEDERRKIQVFKRELPFCMFLLTNVIDDMKGELEQSLREKPKEFIPIKGKLEDETRVKVETDFEDKVNWMSSAQLWSDNYSDVDEDDDGNYKNGKKNNRENRDEFDRNYESKNKDLGAPFLPFKAFSCSPRTEDLIDKDGLLNLSPLFCSEIHRPKPISRCQVSSPTTSHVSIQSQQQAARKARRCWSPELHRRFIAALEQLGGAQVATPKQIRELMKVEGLTNDEVKSHLQKFRLHARRLPNQSSHPSPVMATGGLWVSKYESGSQLGSPQGPLQLACVNSRAISVNGGDSYEEDGKSESYSWK